MKVPPGSEYDSMLEKKILGPHVQWPITFSPVNYEGPFFSLNRLRIISAFEMYKIFWDPEAVFWPKIAFCTKNSGSEKPKNWVFLEFLSTTEALVDEIDTIRFVSSFCVDWYQTRVKRSEGRGSK